MKSCLAFVSSSLLLGLLSIGAFAQQSPEKPSATLHWLDGKPVNGSAGTTLGVPWPRGALPKDSSFTLTGPEGEAVPVQTWPLATWPDGSLKWSAHSIPADAALAPGYRLSTGTAVAAKTPITVKDSPEAITVNTGVIECTIQRGGSHFLSISRDGHVIARDARLVALRQDRADGTLDAPVTVESFISSIESVTLEQSGPIRAVVRITGKHANAGRAWLPFTVRLYFHAGAESVRIMHSFVFDGDEQKDFIKGLGLRFSVPMGDLMHDRHVRFVGENGGVWGEAVRTLTGLRRDSGAVARKNQIDGLAVLSNISPQVTRNIDYVPTWGDFTLYQSTASSYSIRKRTADGFGWIDADQGGRAAGVAYVGGATKGGVLFGLRDFWQRHPTGLDIRGANTEFAEVTLWMWAPSAPAMDLRYYHDVMGMDTYAKQTAAMDITYEDYEPGFGSAHGVARSSEITLWALPATPARERLVALAENVAKPGMLVCDPGQYLKVGVFGGMWSAPDRSTPAKAAIEDRLDFLVDFYKGQVEQRHWYGFWNYGDFMHTYDSDRHVWRYDVGGFAWDNSELSTDLWLWYSFLRTGRADIFRIAEAMTRHVSEVDVHHIGRFAGLGSRHNVQHWGCSAKQVRISSAVYRRFYYYLTADERLGDLLHDLINVDRQFLALDPVRKVPGQAPKGDIPARLSVGTDWCTLAAAWLTEWERSGDIRSRDKLFAGMKGIGASKYGFYTPNFGYDPDTGKTIALDEDRLSYSHLNSMFGAVEICAELISLTKDIPELAGFDRIWMLYCETVNAPENEQLKQLPGTTRASFFQSHSRLAAYAAWRKHDPELAKRAWAHFFKDMEAPKLGLQKVSGSAVLNPVDEAPGVSTNGTAQFGLAAIQNLALIGDELKDSKKP